jgi:LmbE family N-acetylglucosaminyl deacetylase
VATLVTFHAHPDDECFATGGVMSQAADAGHRVVLVVATRGEHGEVDDGFLEPGEQLWERRIKETAASAEVLGVSRVEFLGYVDSGMMGVPENEAPEAFWQADVDEAAERLAVILREENADILTVYDDHGLYGHPDHIQVHRVGHRAAELAGTPKVYESTMDRDALRAMARERAPEGTGDGTGESEVGTFGDDFGSPGELITTRVDVRQYTDRKRRSMQAHASQIGDQSMFLSMPPEAFAAVFGTEVFILKGAPPGTAETTIYEGVA